MFERKCEYEDIPYRLSGYDSISTEIVKTADSIRKLDSMTREIGNKGDPIGPMGHAGFSADEPPFAEQFAELETIREISESVQKKVKYLRSEVDRLNALHKREIIITGEYAQRVIDLTARAEAVEADLRKCSPCWLCKKKCGIFDALDQRKDGYCPNFEWRGQQAGKGDAE